MMLKRNPTMDCQIGPCDEPEPHESLETVPCPLCGEDVPEVLLYGRDRLFAQPGQYRLVRCASCKLKYVSPRPTLASLPRHYPASYFCYKPPELMSPPLRFLLGTMLRELSKRRIAMLERITGRLGPETQIVDVGCGVNALLLQLRKCRGCEGIGVDFKAEVVQYVRETLKMPAVHGTLCDADFAEGRFDVVTMTEYLEHEPNPRPVLTEARRITRRGGHLVIEVPFIEGLVAKVFRSRWSQLDLPRHLVFYTPQTLAAMLKRCGYRLLNARTYGAPFSVGGSVLQTLGFKRLGRLTLVDTLLAGAAGLPFLPLVPFLHEFMFAVARAE